MRRRWLACCVLLLLSPVLVRAQAQPVSPAIPRVVRDTWDAAYLEGVKMGSYHTVVEELPQPTGKKRLRSTLTMDLKIKRYDAVVPLKMEMGCEETPEGKVTGLSMKQFLDRGFVLRTGKVEGEQLLVRVGADETVHKFPFPADALGMAAQERLYQEKKVKPGDKLAYRTYELGLGAPLTLRATVVGPQKVDVLSVVKKGERPIVELVKRELLRVEVVADKIMVEGQKIQLPTQVLWLDAERNLARSEMALPGLGRITLLRTTKEVAMQEGTNLPLLPDLGLNTTVAVKGAVERPHEARGILYRITIQDEDEPGTVFARDARQQVKSTKGNSCELLVQAVRQPAALPDAAPKPEYSAASHFLDSKDEKIRELAAKAVGTESDPWRKAQRIERWVHENMRGGADIGFATASQVARDLRGDCRQHAMLMAALCRAAGIPARTALGLVYSIDPLKGPSFVFHMWTEVWVRGQWLALDAVMGRGSVGPAHLKISDHSWHDVQTLAPMLTVTRVLGKLAIEMVEVRR
jgi:hypothetical protein